jgi:hypothetical protein
VSEVKNVPEKAKGIVEIKKMAVEAIESVLNRKAETVVSMSKEAEGWKVTVEVLERRAVPDTQDILGRYELMLNEEGDLLGYRQVLIRRRQDKLDIDFAGTK